MISGLVIKMALSRQNRRMFLQRLAIKQKMLLRREGDEMHAEYRKFSIPMYPFQLVGDRHGVDLVGSVAHQAEHDTAILMHNDGVVQGLSEVPFMQDVERWGVLTIGTGLGNARFTNRRKDKDKDDKKDKAEKKDKKAKD